MSGTDTELKKHSIVIAGHHTSITLENIFWHLLKQIAQEQNLSLSRLISDIDRQRKGNLSSAIRVFVLQHALRD